MINIKYRLPKAIYEQVLKDLARPHAYAAERIGFLFTRSKKLSNGSILITAIDYVPVDESSYINDEHVGARINSDAILMGMQRARSQKCGVFHVHKHDHKGKPSMSWIDEDGIPPVVESFSHVSANQCHGIIILSKNSLLVNVLPPDETNYIQPSVISIVGYPNRYFFLDRKSSRSYDIYIRQEFLGPDAQYSFENIRVGIVGYGGGGSHVGQQLAHIGVTNQVIFDDDQIEDSNLNRLIGGRKVDLANSTPKTDIARRTIQDILPHAKVVSINSRWQECPDELQQCDIVIGCVDSYLEREQLEAECRRFLIPLIDIGMDVHGVDKQFSMFGQIILSMPGGPCMRCMKFITDENLGKEAAKYGNVGGRPQVVWPNGVLASTAVGLLVDIITGWTGRNGSNIYLAYDGNNGTISDHIRINYLPPICTHYRIEDVGPPNFMPL